MIRRNAGPVTARPESRHALGVRFALAAILLGVLFALLNWSPREAEGAVTADTFTVASDSSDQLSPSIGGGYVAWEDTRFGNSDIFVKKLSDPAGTEIQVTTDPGEQRKPRVGGNFVVWEDDRKASGDGDIYGYDLTSQQEIPIATDAADQRNPDISGGKVIWEESSGSGGWKVRGYDLTTGQQITLPDSIGNKRKPRIDGDLITFEDDRRGIGKSDIYAINLSNGQEFPVSTDDAYKDQPSISNGLVVWRQESVANYDIFGRDLYAMDLETGKVFQITDNAADQTNPVVSGKLVVWTDMRNGKADIYGKDLSTGQEFPISTAAGPQETPAISGETVVWEAQNVGDANYGARDVVGSNLDTAPSVPTGVKAAGSSSGVNLSWNPNSESDLAGYYVYRGDSSGGTFTRLNTTPLTDATYSDADAPKGSISYYRIKAVDVGANESGPASASAAAIAPSGLTLTASPLSLNLGSSTKLSGKLTVRAGSGERAVSGKQVTLEARSAGQANFSTLKNATTAADGTFAFTGVQPAKDTDYRMRFAGDAAEGMAPVNSSSVSVAVIMRPVITMSASPRTLNYGQATRLSGNLSLNGKPLSGKPVILERKAVGASAFTTVTGGRLTTAADGAFSLSGVKPAKNTYYRARFAGDADMQAAASGAIGVRVKAKVSVVTPRVTHPYRPRASISGAVVTSRFGNATVIITRNGKVIARKKVSVRDSRFGLSYRLPGKGKYTVKAAFPNTRTHLRNASPLKSLVVR